MRSSSRPMLLLLAAAYFVMGTGSLAMVGTLPDIAATLGLSRGAVAWIYAAYSIAFAVGAPLVQTAIGDRPRRVVLIGGLVGLTAGSLATAVAVDAPTLVAARLVTAIGSAAIGPVASALGSSLVPRAEQGRALAVIFSGIAIASVVGVPLTTVIAGAVGWRLAFVVIAVASLTVAGLVGFGLDDRSRGERMHPLAALRLAAHPAVAAGLGVMLGEMAALFASYTMIVPLLTDRFGLTTSAVTAALTLFGVAGVGGNVLARHLAGRWSAERSIAVGLGLFVVASLLLLLGPAVFATAVAVLVAWAIGNDVFMPAQQRRMVELAPEARGMALALNASAIYLGSSLGSAIAGILDRRFGLLALPVGTIGLAAVAFAALAASMRAARRGNEDGAAEATP